LDRASALGMPALAITDHDGLYGVVPFWRAARERGIHPVIGAEVTLAHGSHLTLLAETQAGYANLSRLISAGQLAGAKGAPRLAIEDVTRHAAGLLCLSGCRRGAVASAILAGDEALARRAAGRLADLFGRDRFWVELQRHWLPDDARLNAGLLAVAGSAGVGVVATNDVHYATPDGHRLHDALVATKHNVALAELGSLRRSNLGGTFGSGEFYLKGQEEMAALFSECPDALIAARAIAERCHVSLDFSSRRFPAFAPRSDAFPHGIAPAETAFSMLHALCQQGLQGKYRPVTPAAARQLAHELNVIEATGLADYFLIVWDIVRFAREHGIRCQGRGSAANSLAAYVLGITPVDPLRYDLLFERFLSDRTDTMPDIDIDFAADRRDEVIAYVYERYGADHAAMVCNVVTYQARSAVRDAARALGYAPEDVDRISKRARGEKVDEENQLLSGLASQLTGTPRHLSVHVGGMLITAQPLVEIVPLEHATKPGVVVAQWNKDAVEDAGLIKVDLLSLRTLGMLTEACSLIAEQHHIRVELDALVPNDPAVYQLLGEGDTIGCFQVESRAQTQMLPRLQPRCFEDLIVEVSIVRPGPIQGGMVHPYLRRRQGLEPVTYLHPRVEPILQETLGVIIFQEQVIRVAVALAGFTPGEADLLRRAMSRSRSADAMAELRERFLAGAVRNGVEQAVAEEAFRQLQGFATYGFCKSHAAAFALVAYQTLWLKVYYPAEFYCALLNHQPMGFYSPDVVVNDAKRHGIVVSRPDVNRSADGCTLEEDRRGSSPRAPMAGTGSGSSSLRLGLRYLYGLGEAGRTRLLAARGGQRFADLAGFCRRTRFPKPLVRDLIRAGALDELSGSRRQLLWELGGLHYEEEVLLEEPAIPADLPELGDAEAISWDYELLGLSPDDHPLRLLRSRLRAQGVLSAAELADQPSGRVVRVGGLVIMRQAPPTAKGHLFVSLEDETGLVNLIVRPDLYARERGVLHNASALVAEGIVQPTGSLDPQVGRTNSVLARRVKALTG
jgi:error-prone DNA polymerase